MKEIVVALDNVRSALNVGSIFRTCDGAGVKKLILAGITPFPPHPKVVKTAIGADKYVEFEHVDDIKNIIEKYKKDGFKIISIEETEGATDFYEDKFEDDDKYLVIFGNELTGVNPEILKNSDKILKLPMLGSKNSLNVSITVGVVLYSLMFSRNG